MKTVYGLYPEAESAQRAVDALRRMSAEASLDTDQIVVVSSEPVEGYEFATQPKTPQYVLAVVGGILGGALAWWFVSFVQRSYPLPTGAMPIVPAWTNGIIIYEVTMLSAVLTSLVALMVGTHLPKWRQPLSDPEIWKGKILVGVSNPPAESRAKLEESLREAGASEVKEFQPL